MLTKEEKLNTINILLNSVINCKRSYVFLCNEAHRLTFREINKEQEEFLLHLIRSNKPKGVKNHFVYWKFNDKEIRIKYLKRLIREIKKCKNNRKIKFLTQKSIIK